MTDYFSQLEDQLGRATELGIHNRRRLAGRAPHPNTGLVAAAAAMIVVVAAIAVALGTGGTVGSRQRASQGPLSQPGAPGSSVAGLRAGGATHTTAGGTPYCVNSMTHTRAACSSRTGSSPNGGFPAITPHAGSKTTLVAQLPLRARPGARQPAAVCRVLTQGGRFAISIVGEGLTANTKRSAYAVWLTNGGREHKWLGFVNPPVKTNGRLKTAGMLPKNAFRYHKLLITLETQAKPRTPGVIALEGPFHR